jgi:hypothetical protein
MPFSATVDLGSGINTVSCQKHAIGLFAVKYPTTAPGMFLIKNLYTPMTAEGQAEGA